MSASLPAPLRATLRFAPSPNGRLHLGHAYSALLNAYIAEHLGGTLLLRIEDIDPVRSRPEFVAGIIEDLDWLGLRFDGPIRRQSDFMTVYAQALAGLAGRSLVYPCFCSRRAVAERVARSGAGHRRDPDGAPLYPGTCRALPREEADARRRAGEPHGWRVDMRRALDAAPGPHRFRCFDISDANRLVEGDAEADPERWGDAVVGRRDVPTSYHLSVVIDDDAQAVTHVVRGADLRAATDLHVLLQALLDLRKPTYHHHRLIRAEGGEKLAKSKGSRSLAALRNEGFGPSDVVAMLGAALTLVGDLPRNEEGALTRPFE